ncbi:MAG: MoaD/ThiS family protein [Acidobacteria bacterium]|nr:MAG: MoaD/ThiS family protein [Acidobacteriota bacterium]
MRVHFSSHVRSYTGGCAEVEAEGSTLAELMEDLERRFPGIRFRVIDEQDRIRPHMNFFVGTALTRDLQHPIRPGEEVHLLAALSGGAGAAAP